MENAKIDAITKFVNAYSLKEIRQFSKMYIFLIAVLFAFVIGVNFKIKNYNILYSPWMIFAALAIALIAWGAFVVCNVKKHAVSYLLYFGCAGTYISIEFLALGIEYGINVSHFDWIISLLILFLDVLMVVLIIVWRYIWLMNMQVQEPQKINYRFISMGTLLIFPILSAILSTLNSHTQETLMTIIMIFIGYACSIHICLFQNYYIAKKYESIINSKK